MSTEDVRIVHPERLGRALRGSAVGNIIEWYEFGVFGFLITVMGPVFLPQADPTVQSLYLFGTFAVTFVARPLGGVFFGWLGDRLGRRKVLTLTLLLMSFATLLTGLLPGYAQIGIWAPILLVLLRLIQGFSASGEYTSAATFLSEFAPDRERGRYTGILASMIYIGFAFGAGLVGVLQLSTSAEFMQGWGWRIPFLVSLPMTAIALYIRYRVEESPAFVAVMRDREALERKLQQTERNPGIVAVVATQWRALLPVIGIAAAGNVIAYTMFSYVPTYLSQTLGFASEVSNLVLFPLYVVAVFCTIGAGMLSDRIGRRRTLLIGATIALLFAVPAFLLMGTGLAWLAMIGALFVMVASSFFSQSYASTLPEQFPTASRNTALGFAYNIGNAALGGTAPIVIAAIVAATGSTLAPAYYLVGAAVLGLVATLGIKETSRRPLRGSMPNVRTLPEAQKLVAEQSETPLLALVGLPLPYAAYADATGERLSSSDPRVVAAAKSVGINHERQ
ncbi:MFS transporter [Brevibacterium sp.]|uniref:MFS transporter n=1 Tax=Brevibacterium sp. TaxID=1701 RepID=UPI002810BDA1|nr:MFS transporter [Brevibacterium sp.]